MKSLVNVVLVFLLSVHIAVAAEEQAPDRDQTIAYINKIIERLADKHIGYTEVRGIGTLYRFMGNEHQLSYTNGTYSLKRRTISGPVEEDGQKEYWIAAYLEIFDIPIKNINRFSQGEYDNNYPLSPGVGRICIHFDVPLRSKVLFRYETRRYGGHLSGVDQPKQTERTDPEMCIIYPAEDSKNFTRLQNAFLRLKEIESEVRDPFLD